MVEILVDWIYRLSPCTPSAGGKVPGLGFVIDARDITQNSMQIEDSLGGEADGWPLDVLFNFPERIFHVCTGIHI